MNSKREENNLSWMDTLMGEPRSSEYIKNTTFTKLYLSVLWRWSLFLLVMGCLFYAFFKFLDFLKAHEYSLYHVTIVGGIISFICLFYFLFRERK